LERDEAILEEYFEVLKKYGELARSLEKKKFYEEVAAKFYLSPDTTARIIRKQLKLSGHKRHHIGEQKA
jgi:hypothetical protein